MQQYLADRLIATETAPISRVQSAVNLAALEAVNLETAAGAESLPRSRSMLSLKAYDASLMPLSPSSRMGSSSAGSPRMGSRRPSEIALAALSEGHELCGQCLSRCATHDSLTRLDEEVAGILDAAPDEHHEAAEARDARTSVVGHSPFFVRETPSTAEALARSPHPSSPSAGALLVKTAAQCELCQEVATTWQSIIARILQVSLGAGLSYLLWLRFVASKETVKRHLFAINR